MVKKIVFFGPPAAGKTSLRKFLFEGVAADDLMKNPEPASIGLKFNRYEYVYSYPIEMKDDEPEKVPINMALVDTAGQELERWLTDSKHKVFGGADVVLFIFDVQDWDDEMKREYILDLITFTNDTRIELAPDSEFHILAHKIDKIQDKVESMEKLKNKLKQDIQDYIFKKNNVLLDLDVQLTSIQSEFKRDSFFKLLDLTVNLFASV
ncbi:MAG: hypothetical protein ACFFCS_09335 [Candidatus Hodarchaeota archaeon]